MRDLADEPAPKPYTVLTVILMGLATLVAVAIGFLSFGLYLPNLMTFSQVLSQDDVDKAALAAFLFLSAGPVIAAAGNPPGQDHLLPVVAGADRAGAMGSHAAVGVHESRVSRNDGWMGR